MNQIHKEKDLWSMHFPWMTMCAYRAAEAAAKILPFAGLPPINVVDGKVEKRKGNFTILDSTSSDKTLRYR